MINRIGLCLELQAYVSMACDRCDEVLRQSEQWIEMQRITHLTRADPDGLLFVPRGKSTNVSDGRLHVNVDGDGQKVEITSHDAVRAPEPASFVEIQRQVVAANVSGRAGALFHRAAVRGGNEESVWVHLPGGDIVLFVDDGAGDGTELRECVGDRRRVDCSPVHIDAAKEVPIGVREAHLFDLRGVVGW